MSGDVPTPGGLSITSVLDGPTVRVILQGELDLAGAQQMEERMVAIDEEGPARVVIDLGGLAFIDSTGLRLLLQADTRARARGYELFLRPGAPAVQRVFEVTGALDVLRFESP
jgi:anti-sigma B factor antagonist